MIQQIKKLPERPTNRATIIGLSGGMGSGKTTLAKSLQKQGAIIIDVDNISRNILTQNPEVKTQIIQTFGHEILDQKQEINRPALAKKIFTNPTARLKLESIIHPEIRKIERTQRAKLKIEDVAIIDVPLLAETCNPTDYDLIVMINAPIEKRLKRLTNRGLKPQDAKARIKTQATIQERKAIAHLWVENNKTLTDLNLEAKNLWDNYLKKQSRLWPVGQ